MKGIDPIQLILGVIGIVTLVASALAVARASLAKSTIEVLKENNAALGERVDLLEEDKLKQSVRITALETENASLRTLASGKEEIQTLSRQYAEASRSRQLEHADILAMLQVSQTVIQSQHEEVLILIKQSVHTHSGKV